MIRVRWYCESELRRLAAPYKVDLYRPTGAGPTERLVWPREYRFKAVADPAASAVWSSTPVGQLTLEVDNPDLSFVPGQDYYLDFTPVDKEEDTQ